MVSGLAPGWNLLFFSTFQLSLPGDFDDFEVSLQLSICWKNTVSVCRLSLTSAFWTSCPSFLEVGSLTNSMFRSWNMFEIIVAWDHYCLRILFLRFSRQRLLPDFSHIGGNIFETRVLETIIAWDCVCLISKLPWMMLHCRPIALMKLGFKHIQ